MTSTTFPHGVWIFIVASLGSAAGLLPGQVNPTTAETTAAKRHQLVEAALAQVGVTTSYDPQYVKLSYPGGDVPEDRGVCTDVIIRSLRQVNVDLQLQVHEDRKQAPEAYAHDGCSGPLDANIDHRRVPNLMVFFHRAGKEVPISKDAKDYLPGDIVAWRLPSGLLHVGLVTDRIAPVTHAPMMAHNIGAGAQCEDALFAFTIVGHYRWFS